MQIEIPFFGVDRQYANIREEILTAIDQVYLSGKVLDGNKTKEFEQAIKTPIRWNSQNSIIVENLYGDETDHYLLYGTMKQDTSEAS